MRKFSGKLLLGAVSGLSLLVGSHAAKADPTDIENLCEYPIYNEFPLLQEQDCSGPVENREEPTGPYTS